MVAFGIHALSALAVFPLALDGESAGNGNVGLAVISIASIVFGYLLIAALWYFVFRDRVRTRRKRDRHLD